MDKPDPSIRFLRFESDQYYPGGWSYDLTGTFSTLEEALAEPTRYDSGEVYDTWTGETHDIQRDTRPLPVGNDPLSKLIDATMPSLVKQKAHDLAEQVKQYDEYFPTRRKGKG